MRGPRLTSTIISLGLLVVLTGCLATEEARAPAKSPNIILILADTLRADYLGTYGFRGEVSPAIDRLASESVVLERCISQAPWTKPAVASLFTSLDPRTHRVIDHDGRYWRDVAGEHKTSALPDQAVTLAEVLRKHGYRTWAWSGNYWITEELGFSQGFDHFEDPPEEGRNILDAGVILEPAWEWISAHRHEEPFFAYLHFMDVHGPWRWNPEDRRLLIDSPSLGEDRELSPEEIRKAGSYLRHIERSTIGDSLVSWRATYAAGVRVFDRRLGGFLERLRSYNLLEDTTIVLIADHGEELFDHGRCGHGHSLHAHQIHIPVLFRLPGAEARGRRIDDIVSLIDIMPTLISAAGVTSPEAPMQGEDLWPLITGAKARAEKEWAFSGAVTRNSRMISAQNGRYKLIWDYPDGATELYDLQVDPEERIDIAESRPEILELMAGKVREHVSALEQAGSLLKATGSLSPEELERLRSLGYAQ